MSWLVRERPDLRCDFALNEGGGLLLELADGRRVVTIVGRREAGRPRCGCGCSGRAGTRRCPPAPTTRCGTSPPGGRAAARAHERRPAIAARSQRALARLGAPTGDDEAVAWAAALSTRASADTLPAMTRLTVTPTGSSTHEPANVIPPYADVICDCRALPDQDEDDVREHVAAALGDAGRYELEFLEPLEGGTESPIDTPLYARLRGATSRAGCPAPSCCR